VSPGRGELTERLLFAFIEPPVPMLEVSAFIRDALRSVAPLLPVDLLPSSMGAMLLRCESAATRDSIHLLGPIRFGQSVLHLQKPEETSNRFYRVPVWLAFVYVVGFPNEHWYEDKIKDCFCGFAEVAEIDPECLTGENVGPLRLLLEVNDRLEIPRELRISCRQGVGRFGAVAQVIPIRVWPREFQLDSRGNLASFFGPPTPPGAGPSLGPSGPFSSQQQLRPQPHFYSLAFPANTTPRYASNLQHAIDPLGSLAPSASAPATAVARCAARGLILARLISDLAVTSAPAPPITPAAVATPAPPVRGVAVTSRRAGKPMITYQRRRLRSKDAHAKTAVVHPSGDKSKTGRRTSKRLAAKASTNFTDMTTLAVQRKALLNSLSACSVSLKSHVKKRDILSRNLLPLDVGELRRLVSAVKLGCQNAASREGSGSLVRTTAE
jgi:hypothetical protein